jgi:hypothetical protein
MPRPLKSVKYTEVVGKTVVSFEVFGRQGIDDSCSVEVRQGFEPTEMDAGYAARRANRPLDLSSSPSWQAGWDDADLVLEQLARRDKETRDTCRRRA